MYNNIDLFAVKKADQLIGGTLLSYGDRNIVLAAEVCYISGELRCKLFVLDLFRFECAHAPTLAECLQYLESDPAKVIAKAYDLTLNGTELSSGSMRITDYELQQQMFRALKMTDEEIEAKFGFLVEAYKYGAPPHGGMGIGLDRIAMLLCGADSLRDVTAFPKVQNASELMSNCPSEVDQESLDVLGIQIKESKDS